MKLASRPVTRITCQVPRLLSPAVLSALEGTVLLAGFVQPGRIVQLRERKRLFLNPVTDLEESPYEIFHLFFPPGLEQGLLERIVTRAGLEAPGRGSVYSERLEQVLPESIREGPPAPATRAARAARAAAPPAGSRRRFPLLGDLAGIGCILPRGLGDPVARIALELGTCVPAITFGTGTGLRDRLGLLRIAIPAEKELVTLAVPAHDAQEVARLLIEEARLAQPGRGFVYLYPIGNGLLNLRVRVGGQRHAASIDQLIAAVDALWGGTRWRGRFTAQRRAALRRAPGFQRDLLRLTLVCREGGTDRLVRAAVDAGAGGATTERVSQIGAAPGAVPAGWEQTTLVIQAGRRERVLDALAGAGLFEEETAGSLFATPSPLAYSYARRAPARP